MSAKRVFLTGGDGFGWATDENLRLTQLALQGVAECVSLEESEIVHSMWWRGVFKVPREQLSGKRVVSWVAEDVFRFLMAPDSRQARELVVRWIARSPRDVSQLASVGIESRLIPYMVDVSTFRPLDRRGELRSRYATEWSIPTDAYLVGSFQRDTEGADLLSPKLVKGPDVFAEIVAMLRARGFPIHVVLGGPRRWWLRRRLEALRVPYTFVGRKAVGDDISVNILPRSVLNELYNLVDLYIVSSRAEGGPHAVLEASAARCKIVSTPVGLATDVLEPGCIFRTVTEAVNLIADDITSGRLEAAVSRHFTRVTGEYVPAAMTKRLRELYEEVEKFPACPPAGGGRMTGSSRLSRVMTRIRRSSRRRPVVSLWNAFYDPPYGGANQFMMALQGGLQRRGLTVVENKVNGVDVHILQAIWFDVRRFRRHWSRTPMKVIHRIDGPIHLVRGFDRDKDDEVFRLNEECASMTVLQSAWAFQRIVEMGYMPVNPVIIQNAADPRIFHPNGRITFDRGRKIQLISTAWSGNPRKGGPLYKYLDQHLDWDRFQYTFVGRASERFERIRQIPPVPSEDVARLLREHDVYITASEKDPCSNALVEALTCGLPVLYLNDGGHLELVGHGGLPFAGEGDVIPQLDRLVEHYETFQRLIAPPRIDDVAERYFALVRELLG